MTTETSMTWETKLKIALVIIALAAMTLLIAGWLEARNAEEKAEATSEQQALIIKQANDSIAALQKQEAAREAATAIQLADLQSKFNQAQSPQQIATLVAQVMGLKQPVIITTPAATPQNPNPQPIAQVPTSDAPQVKAYVQACEACKVQLPAVQAQVESLQSQQKLAGQQLSAMQNERDAWQKAAKGTWWTNTKRAAKFLAIGAGVGAAAVCGSGHCK